MVLEFGSSLTGDGSCCVAGNWKWGEQSLGLGMENMGELVGQVWLERWASEHDSGGQTLAETPLHTGWRKPKVICPLKCVCGVGENKVGQLTSRKLLST